MQASGDISPIRLAAFEHVFRMAQADDCLSSEQLRAGFQFQERRIPLVNPQQGIFKPRQMSHLLSIRTVFPGPGRRARYEDQRTAYRRIYEDDAGEVDYAFMGTDPQAPNNQWLLRACEAQVPVLYFVGIAPKLYMPVLAFISSWDPVRLRARVMISDLAWSHEQLHRSLVLPQGVRERSHAYSRVKRRLHQTSFRQAVMRAYGERCAITRLPELQLLDAAHIIPDADEELGQAVISNGIALSKLHHAAFDRNLLGIDPDYRLHISEKLLHQQDGPMLELLKGLDGRRLHLPRRVEDRPDPERLERRFRLFSEAT